MNNLGAKMIRWIAALSLFAVPGMHAKATARQDFSDFRGHYTGIWVISITGTSVATTVAIEVNGPANGSKLSAQMSGLLSASGQSYPILTSFSLDDKHKIKGTAALMGFDGPVATYPAKITGKKSFNFSLSSVPGSTLSGTPISSIVFYNLKFTKSGLTIFGTGTLTIGGSTSPVTFTITARKKKG